jgi:hypothetical protein
MATTDTRTGFRLPWSSERPHDDGQPEGTTGEAGAPVDQVVEASEGSAPEASGEMFDDGTGETAADVELLDAEDIDARLGGHAGAPGQAAATSPAASASQEPFMTAAAPSSARAPMAPKKPSKLMTDLAVAIRATAEAARVAALDQLDAEAVAAVEEIRSTSKDGEAALRVGSDEDIAGIREWSKAEIARVKERTEAKIEARKVALGDELAAHADETDRSVGAVEALAAAYRDEMAAYVERLRMEDDPARLASMAETMPEPPVLVVVPGYADVDEPEETMAEADEADVPEVGLVADHDADPPAEMEQPVAVEADPAPVSESETPAVPAAMTWGSAPQPEVAQATPAATGPTTHAFAASDDASGWAAHAPTDTIAVATAEVEDEPAAPMDREEIMAALEAAAEAVVAAEASAGSYDQAGESATESAGADAAGERDPWADMAFSARLDASGFDTDAIEGRLAAFLPSPVAETADPVEAQVTRVVVSGLVSVASIASFKRHLGRLPGVQGVAVASGPEGEFVFTVSHRPDVSFRDAIPTLPGFAARVTGDADGALVVTARDPETEG